jgi:hypothetical protein
VLNVFESEFCEVRYLDDMNVVLVTWKKFCSGDDYRKPLLFALKTMGEHTGCDFVADTRDGFEDDPADLQWIFDEFIPLARTTTCQHIFFIIDRDNSLKKELEAQTGELKNYFTVKACFDLDEVRKSLKDRK